MGNTSSSRLKRDSLVISKPRVLTSPQAPPPLGPAIVVSPEATHSHASLLSATSASTVNVNRRATIDGPRTRLNLIDTVDVRRSRTANASPGPTREDRASILGAPPPYSTVVETPSLHNVSVDEHRQDGLSADPDPPAPRSHHGHRRTQSAANSGSRTEPRTRGALGGEEDTQRPLPPIPPEDIKVPPEEYGYGAGSESGLGSKKYASVTMLPPTRSVSSLRTSRVHTQSRSTLRSNSTSSTEDPLELLRKYKTIFIIDDSSSMEGDKWTETREALASLADAAAKYGTDGIDAYFLNAKRMAQNMRSAASVKRQFDSVVPQGISLIAEKLEELLNDYLSALECAKQEKDRGMRFAMEGIKPVNYIIITDGVPTDDPESVIVQAAKRLDAGNFPLSQVGIQFVQVGNDPQATEALRELDDELSKTYGIRDIVDTTPYSGGPLDSELLIKILLGGINRRVDRKGAKSVMT